MNLKKKFFDSGWIINLEVKKKKKNQIAFNSVLNEKLKSFVWRPGYVSNINNRKKVSGDGVWTARSILNLKVKRRR